MYTYVPTNGILYVDAVTSRNDLPMGYNGMFSTLSMRFLNGISNFFVTDFL